MWTARQSVPVECVSNVSYKVSYVGKDSKVYFLPAGKLSKGMKDVIYGKMGKWSHGRYLES